MPGWDMPKSCGAYSMRATTFVICHTGRFRAKKGQFDMSSKGIQYAYDYRKDNKDKYADFWEEIQTQRKTRMLGRQGGGHLVKEHALFLQQPTKNIVTSVADLSSEANNASLLLCFSYNCIMQALQQDHMFMSHHTPNPKADGMGQGWQLVLDCIKEYSSMSYVYECCIFTMSQDPSSSSSLGGLAIKKVAKKQNG